MKTNKQRLELEIDASVIALDKIREKRCACPSPDRYSCYFIRYPNQMELDGRDYCECPCHADYDADEEDELESSPSRG